MKLFSEFDIVSLTKDYPGQGVKRGAVGTILHIFDGPVKAYEVEFTDSRGKTITLLTLSGDEIKKLD